MPDIENTELIPRSYGLLLREIREDKREADFVASTEAIDGHGTVVEQNWELERFLANPVILFAHNARELPVGQATRAEVSGGVLECTIRFASEAANPKAEQVWQSVREKTLRGVSVGFLPIDYAWEKRDGREVLVFKRQELLEISMAPVPSNPEALAKLKARAMAARNEGVEPKQEKPMGDKDKDESAVRALQEKNAALETRIQALEGQNKRLVEERDAAVKRADDAESKVLEQEIDALVGRKITAEEKDSFVQLAKVDRGLFEKMVAQRRDMKLDEAVTQQSTVTTPEGKAPEGAARVADLDDVTADFNQAASA